MPVAVNGIEHLAGIEGSLIFAANHISHLDAPAILAALPLRLRRTLAPAARQERFRAFFEPERFSKKEFLRAGLQYALVGIFFNVYLLPQQMAGVRTALKTTGELVSRGYCPLVFPEGERTPDGKIHPFQPGVGLMAVRLKVPVVPVFIDGLYDLYSVHDSWPKRGPIAISFGPPIKFPPDTNYTDAAKEIEDAVRRLQIGQETLTLRLFDLAKPTIAALPGAAAGAGMSIALACDLRIAAESAFVTSAFANIGLSGDYGGSWLLTQLVGVARAKELYYTSRRVGAAEGLALGIFNEVVPDDRLMARTRALAESIASGPPLALRYMKENLNRAVATDLRSALALEADRMVRCTRTEDHREAVQAFIGKRKPTFQGR